LNRSPTSWRGVLGIEVEESHWMNDAVPRDPFVELGAHTIMTGWLPGYQDPEYYLRLLFQSTSRTNEVTVSR